MSVGRSVLSATWPAQILGPAHTGAPIGPGQALRCRMHTQPIAFVGFQNFHDLPVRLLHGPSGGRLCCLTSHRANPVDLEWDRRELAGPVQMKERSAVSRARAVASPTGILACPLSVRPVALPSLGSPRECPASPVQMLNAQRKRVHKQRNHEGHQPPAIAGGPTAGDRWGLPCARPRGGRAAGVFQLR